jgi:phosphatidylserine/phosphatidylglycerophosphate/cardiolipin synthase-like enzyme
MDVLQQAGIPIRRIPAWGWKKMHQKFIVFDRKVALTPDYNYSRETLRDELPDGFTSDRAFIRDLEKVFQELWNDSDHEHAP